MSRESADEEMTTLRERLAAAGLLAVPEPVRSRPDPVSVAEARRELGASGLLASDMVSEQRG